MYLLHMKLHSVSDHSCINKFAHTVSIITVIATDSVALLSLVVLLYAVSVYKGHVHNFEYSTDKLVGQASPFIDP